VLTKARIIVFPLLGATDRLTAICQDRIAGPSGGRVRAAPLAIPLVNKSLLLLACADFPHIASDDPQDSQLGYITERDVGFCLPVKLTVAGQDRGIHVVNPLLWVDNPAGVIEGREIFGFPKILATIPWETNGALTFEVDSLVFHRHSPTTAATIDWLLKVEPAGLLGALATQTTAMNATDPIPDVTRRLVDGVLGVTAFANLGVAATGFDRVRLALLKQFRAVEAAAGDPVCYQDVVRAEFEIKQITGAWTHLLGGRHLVVADHASVPIADILGIDFTTPLPFAVEVRADLRLTGSTFA